MRLILFIFDALILILIYYVVKASYELGKEAIKNKKKGGK